MAHLHTPLCDLLGIRIPLIQAPMPSASTPELVAAVGKAGGLGSFGFAYTQPETMQREAEAARALSNAPFNLNLFVSQQPGAVETAAQREALDAVAGYCKELGLPPPEAVRPPYAPDLDAQLRAVEEIRPAVFTFHLGDVSQERARRIQALGVKIGGSATCIAEAQPSKRWGWTLSSRRAPSREATVATYLRNPYDSMIGTFAAVGMIVRNVQTPVVAAGGIMDGPALPLR